MKIRNLVALYIAMILLMAACKKSDFLNKKPITNLQVPTTLSGFQNLLENTTVFNFSGALCNFSTDEYTLTYDNWQTLSATERNGFVWASDVYQGDANILDWNTPYQQVFYANSVLDGLSKSDSINTAQGEYLKSWALFNRAYAFYELTRSFCKAYDPASAMNELGIPLRLSSDIDYTQERSTLQESYEQIFADITQSINALPSSRPSANLNRPSKIAAYALLARIYLDMRDYTEALKFSDQALSLYSTLIDYNTVSKTATTPFTTTNDELIYNVAQVSGYGIAISTATSKSAIAADLIAQYNTNDLRLAIYFAKRTDGTYYRKRGYVGSGLYPFTGLATDELYLIKAECHARAGQITEAMTTLNALLGKRYIKGTFTDLVATDAQAALSAVLLERKKELAVRGLRWYDLKRLNAGGAQINLTRTLNGQTYTLPANDNRWIFPIPSDEISRSGIIQNPR